MDKKLIAKKQTFAGLFIITLATLMFEILLTRIFSVTMWYHFAFMAISIALFGMTVGAIMVYLLPFYFTSEKVRYQLAISSLMFAVFIVVSFFIHLNISVFGFTENLSKKGLLFLSINYIVIAIPFIFSGITVCLALTRFPRQISTLYAVDLGGAASGCILLIYILNITDGPTSVIIVAFLACCGSAFFAHDGGFRKLLQTSLICACLLFSFAIANTFLVYKQNQLIKLKWVKGERETQLLYEKWNSFSRITIKGNPDKPENPFGWGLSASYSLGRKNKQLALNIDASAGTVLTAFDGNLDQLEHLKYDITNVVHYIRQNAKVFIIGTGGGRDILSAMVFDQKSIVGMEINKDIIETVNKRFGNFTGHLDKFPNITFINDEARSYITRQKDCFDIIQASLIDTWAATASGAFVLAENSLYTVEAWKLFLEHLAPNGILTFSRWYYKDRPREIYRLTSLATSSLQQSGINNPRAHIIILRNLLRYGTELSPSGVGTILVSKEPFSRTDLSIIEEVAKKMQFDIVLSPHFALDTTFATIASGKNLDKFLATFPFNISAPTDDSPFFFNMLRLRDMFSQELWNQEVMKVMNINLKAVAVLGVLLITVSCLTLLCVIMPLILTTKKAIIKNALPLFIYFASIGFGFILIEISQMQRLIVFLGHPTYSLSVVLFSLLLFSGFGSYATQRITNTYKSNIRIAIILLFILLCVLIVFGLITPAAIKKFQGSITVIRICVAAGILSFLGLFMGMAFPLGMKLASTRSISLAPWLWGINGATSVCGSVLAIAIALSSSISTSFWLGSIFYAFAFCAFIWESQKKDF